MTWFNPLSQHFECNHRTRLRQQKETPLQLESLEDRHLLAAEPFLIDINQTGNPSDPSGFTEVNDTAFFVANDGSYGRELWMSDGSSAGTQLIKNIRAFGVSSSPKFLTNVADTLFFIANDGRNGEELWRSDGSSEGTQLVKDIRPGSRSSQLFELTEVNGTLFFRANDGSNGIELWKSDGTSAGTQLVKDITPGSGHSLPSQLTNINGTLFFEATDEFDLWMSDGTSSGTVRVKDIHYQYSTSYRLESLTNVNGVLFFSAETQGEGRELWRSNGTSDGTYLLKDIRTGYESSNPNGLTNVNGTLFFRASDQAHGSELWMSDGTNAGTLFVQDIPSSNLSSHPQYLTAVNGSLFFIVNNGLNGIELWKSDGTSSGTQFVKDFLSSDGSSLPKHLTNVNGTLFFQANNGSEGTELWMSNGTSGGTQLVRDILTGGFSSSPQYLTNINGTLFFQANDGSHGVELWKSNGTFLGTLLVNNINPVPTSSSPGDLVNLNGTLFFRASDQAHGSELWKSDGTTLGTQLVKDIQPSTQSSSPRYLVNVNGTLFFTANDGLHGYELWMSDGTSEGTQLVRDIHPGPNNSFPSFLTNFHGLLYFSANDGSHGYELWRSNGTTFNTQLVNNLRSGSEGSYPAWLVNVNDTLYFSANNGYSGTELWRLIGTTGSVRIKDIFPGSGSSYPGELTNFNGILLFRANDGVHGNELWRSEGTSSTTYQLIDLEPGIASSTPALLTKVKDVLFFSAYPTSDRSLWKTDGTSLGTEKLRNSRSWELSEANNTLYFHSPISHSAVGLFKSSQPFTTTELAFENVEGTFSSLPRYMTNVNGTLFFSGFNQDSDNELWVLEDDISPSITITPDSGIFNNNSIQFILDFSEVPYDFDSNDIQITNGVTGALAVLDEDTFAINVTPNSDGEVIFSINQQSFHDASGNGNLSASASIVYDGTVPVVNITPDGNATNNNPVLFTFEFSEEIVDFIESDIVITGGMGSNFTMVDGDIYTIEVTPTAEGEITVSVADDSAEDVAGNLLVGDGITVIYDGTAPTVVVTPNNLLTNVATTVFTFEFSEEVFDFTADDVMVINGSKGTFTMVDGDIYTLQVTAMADGDVIVNALAYGATDAAGNGNQVESATVTYDGTAPTLIITPDSGVTNNTPITFTLEFSEEIFEFIEGDITITGGVGSNFTMVDEDTYTIDVTPDADGDVTVSVANEAAEDAAGNLLVGDMATIEYDSTAPTLAITTPDIGETNDDPILFTFFFYEDVIGFDAGDIMVTGGTAGTFTTLDDFLYTLEVTTDAEDTDVTVTVADGVAQDAAMNDNVGDSATITYNAIDETPLIVTGTDAGGPATVRVFDPSGNELLSFMPYGAFTGGVRVATGDINGDGILDIITAAGPGGGPHVQVFDSRTGQLITGGLNNFYAYAPNVTTGVFVAVGDVNDDGYDDIITAPDAGGGPHLKVYNGLTGDVITEFYAYAPNVTVGVRIATGDINGDGFAEIITTPGPGGGPHVRVINGMTGEQMPGPVTNFYAYAPNVLTGLYVATGDVNGDGFDDIITSPGAGGGPHIQAFSSADGSTLQNFYAYHPNFVGGVRVGSADLNQDGFADIITVPGSSGGPHTRAFSGVDLSDLSNFFSGSPTNTDGLFIASGISYIPIEDPSPTSTTFSDSFKSDSVNNLNTSISDTSDTIKNVNSDTFKPKKSWYDEVDEFYQSSEEIDKLFTGLGIE
ncbi:Hypothetical protein PBC10988_4490 [Planctomycetales bacterium 10988]|nr:Hypothetical protein PBC10988_4490 [Planctomycetales bacterium 10988]